MRDGRDHGTIVDFVQRRRKVSLGGVRQILRAWTGGSAGPPLPRLEPSGHNRSSVVEAYQRMTVASRHAYPERERGLPAAMLSSPRFVMRVRMDRRGSAVFPHFDWHGLCGYEIKNRGSRALRGPASIN